MLGQTVTPQPTDLPTTDGVIRENQRSHSPKTTKTQSPSNTINRGQTSTGANINPSKLIHPATQRVKLQSKVATTRSESPPLSSPSNFILDPAPHNPLCDASFGYFDRVIDPYFSTAHPQSPIESGLSPIVSAVKPTQDISTAAELNSLPPPLFEPVTSHFDMLSPSTVNDRELAQKGLDLDMPMEGHNEHLDKNWTWSTAEKSVHEVLRAPDERLPRLDDETSADEGNVWKRAQEASDRNFSEGLQALEKGKNESRKQKEKNEDDSVFKEFLRDDIDYDDTLNTHHIIEEENDVAILQ